MNPHECGEVFAMLSEYLDNQLPASGCSELEAHLSDCPPCIDFVASLRRSIRLCRQLGGPSSLPPPQPERLAELKNAYREMLDRRGKT